MTKVSVVMPVYNGERFLAGAIESILRQTFTDLEFIIVDDGSTDGSAALIQEYAERDSRIRFLRLAENKGVAVARNTGVARATGKYLTAMDSDDVSLPQRLEKQAAFLDAHPDIGAVGVSHVVCDENLNPRVSQRLPARHHAIVLHHTLYTRSAMKCANVMLRREYFDIEPLYDPGIAYCIDVELFMRLSSEKKIRFANLTEQLYLYRRHENTQASRHQAIAQQAIVQARLPSLRQLGERGAGVEWIVEKIPPIELNWREQRKARRDVTRLIAAMREHNWVDADDEPLLHDEMNQLLESMTPRYWQIFLHWYRRRIARGVQS